MLAVTVFTVCDKGVNRRGRACGYRWAHFAQTGAVNDQSVSRLGGIVGADQGGAAVPQAQRETAVVR